MQADRRWYASDAAMASALLLLGLLQWLIEGSDRQILLGIVWMTVPVAIRRVQPLVAVAANWSALVVFEGLERDVTSQGYAAILALVITAYSVARHGRRWEPWAGLGVALACAWLSVLFQRPIDVPSLLLTGLVVVAPWTAGYTVRRAAAGRDRIAAENQLLVLDRERYAREAIARSRVDIAREMHDVLGHSLAVMVMQLGAADHAFERDPERSRAAIRGARAAGKEAISEVRSLVALYRDEETAEANRPVPRLEDVPGLVADLAERGLDVRLTMPEDLSGPAPTTNLAAYRVVQESLTNAIRHGTGDISVSIRIDDELVVQVDNAAPVADGPPEPGYGLIGMDERVRSCGGTLTVHRAAGRFGVEARLPVAP